MIVLTTDRQRILLDEGIPGILSRHDINRGTKLTIWVKDSGKGQKFIAKAQIHNDCHLEPNTIRHIQKRVCLFLVST